MTDKPIIGSGTGVAGTSTQTSEGAKNIDPVVGKSVSEVLGEIVWLMSQNTDAKELKIKDIERLIMPAILLRQFHIEYASIVNPQAQKPPPGIETDTKANGGQNLQPVSVEVFAMCSDAVSAALEANPDIQLTLQDWRSGPNKRVIASYSIKDSMQFVS